MTHAAAHHKKVHIMQVILEEQQDDDDAELGIDISAGSLDIGGGGSLALSHGQTGHSAMPKSVEQTNWTRQHALPLFLYTLCLLVLLALLFATTRSAAAAAAASQHEPVLASSSAAAAAPSSARSMHSLRALISEASSSVADAANRLVDFFADKSLAVHAGMP